MPAKVLIVDDEANIVISLEFLMEQAGYAVAIARNGDEALEKIEGFRPDLVLLDVMLPGVNGFDILQRVRQQPEYRNMAIIMLTAKGREVEVTKGLALGANAYITKPFSTRELLAEVRRHLDVNHETLAD
ncbi:MAG: response regulator transcription factor [Caldilinea sp.]